MCDGVAARFGDEEGLFRILDRRDDSPSVHVLAPASAAAALARTSMDAAAASTVA